MYYNSTHTVTVYIAQSKGRFYFNIPVIRPSSNVYLTTTVVIITDQVSPWCSAGIGKIKSCKSG